MGSDGKDPGEETPRAWSLRGLGVRSSLLRTLKRSGVENYSSYPVPRRQTGVGGGYKWYTCRHLRSSWFDPPSYVAGGRVTVEKPKNIVVGEGPLSGVTTYPTRSPLSPLLLFLQHSRPFDLLPRVSSPSLLLSLNPRGSPLFTPRKRFFSFLDRIFFLTLKGPPSVWTTGTSLSTHDPPRGRSFFVRL